MVWEKIGATIAGFTKRPVQIPAQAVADGHARRRLPLILEKESKRRLVDVACSIAERARSPIQPAKQHLREDNVVAGDRNVIRWVRGRKFVGSLETEEARPGAVPQAAGRRALIVTTEFERVVAFDPGSMGRHIVGLSGAGAERVALDAADVPIGHTAGINRRHAEVCGAQRTRVDAQAQRINLVIRRQDLGEA